MRIGKLLRLVNDEVKCRILQRDMVVACAVRLIISNQLALFARLQERDVAVCFLPEEILLREFAVIDDGQHDHRGTRAAIFRECAHFDVAVVVHAPELDVRERHIGRVMRHVDRIDELLLSIVRETVELVVDRVLRDVEHAVIVAPQRCDLGEFAQKPLPLEVALELRLGILCAALTDIHRAGTDRRIHRDGLDIIMQVPANDEIHAAPFGNRHEIAIIEHVRVRMMRDEDAPVRSFRLRAQKVLFDPGERLAHLPPRLLIGFRRRIDGVHLEETPGIAVHHREMDTADVERIREPTIRRICRLRLWRKEQCFVKGSVIMVARDVPGRDGCEHLRNLVEPIVRILIVLEACAEGNVAAVQEEIRLHMLHHLAEPLPIVEKVRIRKRDEVQVLRVFLLRAER